MQQTATNQPSPAAPSFAGLLAALAAPTPKTAWNNDDLADDVATLSYENALRTHARYKPAEPNEWGFAQAAELAAAQVEETCRANEAANSEYAAPQTTTAMDSKWSEDAEPKAAQSAAPMFDRNLKCASITIRLSKAECDQLKNRAAAAGLTVSAYLRSCTFEAEALRAQVKEALAELRASAAPRERHAEEPRKAVKARRSWLEWLSRLLPHGGHQEQRLARA